MCCCCENERLIDVGRIPSHSEWGKSEVAGEEEESSHRSSVVKGRKNSSQTPPVLMRGHSVVHFKSKCNELENIDRDFTNACTRVIEAVKTSFA